MTRREEGIEFELTTKTVQDLVGYYADGRLDLSPPFQRKSVWSDRDRAKLIESVFIGYPIPSIFLYERLERGTVVYEVIDGKQRIETSLRFMGRMRPKFDARVQLPDSTETVLADWQHVRRKQASWKLESHRIPVQIVRGNLAEIIDLFIRINSTGKALTAAEKRNAKFYNNPFMQAAERLAKKLAPDLQRHGVITPTQLSRMKHIELACELMLTARHGEVLNKKTAVDRVMQSNDVTRAQTTKSYAATHRAIKRLLKVLPQIKTTRFSKLSDFYSLAVLFMKMEQEGLILTDRKRNKPCR